jgi:hypothetical protein
MVQSVLPLGGAPPPPPPPVPFAAPPVDEGSPPSPSSLLLQARVESATEHESTRAIRETRDE